jgi:hypothetical protein
VTTNPFILILTSSGMSFVIAWYWFARNAKVDAAAKHDATIQKLMDRISELEKQQLLMGAAMAPLSTVFQARLIKELTHFHTPEMDALMAKMGPPYTLTVEEEGKLIQLLKQRQADMSNLISDSERDAALMLPLLMKRVKNETVVNHEPPVVLVTTTADVNDKPEDEILPDKKP